MTCAVVPDGSTFHPFGLCSSALGASEKGKLVAELTRFDFHVNRFLNSEDVENMTAEEVGQYLLLLCHSFVKGREASLPDDPGVLARYARVDKVSKLVLKKFPVVETEWGPRRRNETLYTEFLLAKKRSENGRSAVAERWEKESNTPVIRPYNDGNTNEDRLVLPIPYHTNPSHTTPHQPTPSSFSPGNWKTLAIRFRGVIGKFISSTKTNKQRYSEFCNQFGEDKVLSVFEQWASQNKSWVSEKGDALFFFWKELPDLVEAVSSEQKSQEPEVPVEKVTEAMVSSLSERTEAVTELLEAIRKKKEFEDEHRDEI